MTDLFLQHVRDADGGAGLRETHEEDVGEAVAEESVIRTQARRPFTRQQRSVVADDVVAGLVCPGRAELEARAEHEAVEGMLYAVDFETVRRDALGTVADVNDGDVVLVEDGQVVVAEAGALALGAIPSLELDRLGRIADDFVDAGSHGFVVIKADMGHSSDQLT